MPISYDVIKEETAQMYARSLRRIPDDAKRALKRATETETNPVALNTLGVMLKSAQAAEERHHFVCSDNGIPVYTVKVGTQVQFSGDVKRAIRDGFAGLTRSMNPPMLKHVTNPLTNERSYEGKDVPIVTFDMIDGADYVEIICSPKALGSGRWAALDIFTFPSLDQIEEYIMDVVLRAGSQACPPLIVGVGIGGTFDYATKMAKEAIVRPMGEINPEPILQDMEKRLLAAINETGFGPMGTGGRTTAMGVHINYASGHGFTPVAVAFNCWIDRRSRIRIMGDGTVERFE